MALDIALFIPARLGSRRLPMKPLVPIRGKDGIARPLIHYSWEAACRAPGVTSVHVLTDNDAIAETIRELGGQVLMTPSNARNGTERCAMALDRLDRTPDVVVNLQGDAFLTPPGYVRATARLFQDADTVQVATPVFPATGRHLERLETDQTVRRIGATTAVVAQDGRALYFSKAVLPSAARRATAESDWPVLHHVGLYAYTPDVLRRYVGMPPGPLELAEGLEQLRFLENGIDIHCARVDAPEHGFWEVNNPEDIPVVEAMLVEGECS